MPQIQEHVKTRLESLPAIPGVYPAMAELANGKVWTQRIDRKKTPEAFDPQPPQLMRRSIAVISGAESPAPGLPRLGFQALTLWMRWADSAEQNAIAESMIEYAHAAICNQVVGVTGNCGMIEFVDRFDQADPWFEGGRMCYLRYRVAGFQSGL